MRFLILAGRAGGRASPYRPGEFYGEMDALGNVTGRSRGG